MDFSELDDILDDTDYVPTFGRAAKPAAPKTLVKNSSVKSIDSGVGQSLTKNNNLSFLDINKDTKKETTTFQDFFKQKATVETKNQPRRERSLQPKQQAKETKPNINKNDFNPNNILDEEDDVPAVGRRNMKPPLVRKNEDNKSVGTRKDDNKSVASVADFKKTTKEQQKPIFQNFSIPITPLQFEQQKQLQQTLKTQFPTSQKEINQKETTITNTVNIDFKAIIEQQLKLERQLNKKMMAELQESHKSQIERLTKLHQEQIKRRLQLKDLELKTFKQHYQLRIKSISDRVSQVKDMQQASSKISEGIRALQRAQQQFKSKALKLEQQNQSKNYQNKSFEMFYNQKQKNIKQMTSKLEDRQRQFRSQKQNAWQNLERQRKKNQEFEVKLLKRQRQLDDQFNKKMRRLEDQFDQKSRKLNEEQSKIKYNKLQFEQQKLRLQQQKEQNLTRMKKWQESRLKMMEELQLQKAKLLTRETELNSLERQYEMKQNDLAYMQKQITSKAKFMELERKKNEVESASKKRTGTSTFYGNFTRQFKEKYDEGPTVFQKSLKQLKDEYLKNLGHI